MPFGPKCWQNFLKVSPLCHGLNISPPSLPLFLFSYSHWIITQSTAVKMDDSPGNKNSLMTTIHGTMYVNNITFSILIKCFPLYHRQNISFLCIFSSFSSGFSNKHWIKTQCSQNGQDLAEITDGQRDKMP